MVKRRRKLSSRARFFWWVAMGVLSRAMTGGVFLILLTGREGEDVFNAGARIGVIFGAIGGCLMGIVEIPEPLPERRRFASRLGSYVGLMVFLIGAIPGAAAGYIAACWVEAIESVLGR